MFDDANVPDYHPEALLALCRDLLPDDPSLAEEVRLAADRPESYVATFEHRLWRRAIYPKDAPRADLPWIALLDGLMARNRLVEMDLNEQPRDVRGGVNRLLRQRREHTERWAWADDAWDEAPTEEFLMATGQHLLADGLVLASLLVESDSYPLMLVDEARFPHLQRLADRAGYGRLAPCLPGNVF